MAKEKAKTDQADATPDTMSPGKRRQLQKCFERANELASKEKPDFDYAHDLYAQAVNNDPGNLVYVEAMLSNLQKKFNNNKKGSRFNFGGRKAFKEAVSEEDWPSIFSEGIEILKSNPWDTHALREMARACAFNRYNEVELRYLKNALDGKPKDVEVNRHCAQSLARLGQFDMAISCWNRVDEKTKTDEAQKMMSELTLAKTMGQPASIEAIGAVGDRPMSPMPLTAPAEGAEEAKPDSEADRSGKESAEDDSEGNTESTAQDSADGDTGFDDDSDSQGIKLNERQALEKAIPACAAASISASRAAA